MADEDKYDRVWQWKTRLPERKGQRCRILVYGKKNTVLVEFDDGYRVATCRYAVRKVKTEEPGE